MRSNAVASAVSVRFHDLKPSVLSGGRWRSGFDRFFVTIIRKVEKEDRASLDGWAIAS